MSDNIFGERFAGYREPAWHKLGTVFTDPLMASDACRLAGLDYEMSLQKIIIEVTTLFGTELVPVEDQVMIVRDKTADDPCFRTFGVVSPNYGLIQNMDIAAIVDPLSEKWPVETAGALGKGETIFLTLQCPSFDVAGDEIKGYFLVTNSSDGKKSLQIAFTPVRVVCQNTLTMGLSQARASALIKHHADAHEQFTARIKLLEDLQQIQYSTGDLFNKLAETAISDVQAAEIFEAAYPEVKKSRLLRVTEELGDDADIPAVFSDKLKAHQQKWEIENARNLQSREGAKFCYQKLNDEFPAIAGTAWAAYNSVVECSDFREGHADAVDYAALFGYRAKEKERGFKKAVEFVRVR